MPYTYKESDATPEEAQITRVRNYTDDITDKPSPVKGKDFFLTDFRIRQLLDDVKDEATTEVNRALLAAAAGLRILAKNQAFVQKKQRTLSKETDGKAVADSLRADAKAYEERVRLSEQRIIQKAVEAASTPDPVVSYSVDNEFVF